MLTFLKLFNMDGVIKLVKIGNYNLIDNVKPHG